MFDHALHGEVVSMEELESMLERFTAEFSVGSLGLAEAGRVLAQVGRCEKLIRAARGRIAARVAELSQQDPMRRVDPVKAVAEATGEDLGTARRDLEVAERAGEHPSVRQAMDSGTISPTQAAVMLDAATVDPESLGGMLAAADAGETPSQLRRRADRIKAAKRSEEEARERHARMHRNRKLYFGTTAEGGVFLRGEFDPVMGSAIRSRLERLARMTSDPALAEGRAGTHEARMADALYQLTNAGAPPSAHRGDRRQSDTPVGVYGGLVPRADLILHVDVEALRRGHLEPDEQCEIEGCGPVSLAVLEDLFGNAWAKVIISKGKDIVSVTHLGRTIPAHLETALSRRDTVCQVPGCGVRNGLERDHIIPISEGGPTELANLVKLCRRHHFTKTYGRFRLVGRPGSWRWIELGPNEGVIRRGSEFVVAQSSQSSTCKTSTSDRSVSPDSPGLLGRPGASGRTVSSFGGLTVRSSIETYAVRSTALAARPTTPSRGVPTGTQRLLGPASTSASTSSAGVSGRIDSIAHVAPAARAASSEIAAPGSGPWWCGADTSGEPPPPGETPGEPPPPGDSSTASSKLASEPRILVMVSTRVRSSSIDASMRNAPSYAPARRPARPPADGPRTPSQIGMRGR
jgi:5-methylcytosine-specific restriction endonuclease McrA